MIDQYGRPEPPAKHTPFAPPVGWHALYHQVGAPVFYAGRNRAIRSQHARGVPVKAIADYFDLTRARIHQILEGETAYEWRTPRTAFEWEPSQ